MFHVKHLRLLRGSVVSADGRCFRLLFKGLEQYAAGKQQQGGKNHRKYHQPAKRMPGLLQLRLAGCFPERLRRFVLCPLGARQQVRYGSFLNGVLIHDSKAVVAKCRFLSGLFAALQTIAHNRTPPPYILYIVQHFFSFVKSKYASVNKKLLFTESS